MKRSAPRQTKNNLGQRLCRNCPKLTGKGRRSYCSKECADDFAIKYFPSFTRNAVRRRDQGVCAKCGIDTEKLRRILRWVGKRHFYKEWGGWDFSGDYKQVREVARELGFTRGVTGDGDFWQADHIQECARGGWGKGIDNFRTLCTPCHNEETARLAAELAKERKLLKDMPLLAQQPSS